MSPLRPPLLQVPKYIPKTPQYFHGNTYARNNLDGVFYGNGGDTHHIDDRFVSNDGSADFTWWFFPSRYESRWIPNIKNNVFLGGKHNHNHQKPFRGKGVEGNAFLSPIPSTSLFAPNSEHFLVDGAEFVDVNGGDFIEGSTGFQKNVEQAAISACFDCCGYRGRHSVDTIRLHGLAFHNTSKILDFPCPGKQIYFDLDGTLTGEAKSTVIPYAA